ncbi:MAG: hypothetical protein KBT68_00470 [bacterium]|nr:hypothetical protein [Candidatus Colisoma equi]
MKLKEITVGVLAASLLSGCCCSNKCCKKDSRVIGPLTIDPVIGNWGAKLPYDDMYAGSFIFSRDENGVAKAFVLWRWGSPEWCSDVKVSGSEFSLRHPYGQLIRGKVCGEKLCAEIAPCDKEGKATGEYKSFKGWRIAPACPFVSTGDAKFGESIDLLKDGLDGR